MVYPKCEGEEQISRSGYVGPVPERRLSGAHALRDPVTGYGEGCRERFQTRKCASVFRGRMGTPPPERFPSRLLSLLGDTGEYFSTDCQAP